MATIPFPNIVTPPGPYAITTQDLSLDVATTNDIANGANDSSFQNTGKEILVVFNQSGAPINLLLTSVADPTTGRVTSPNPLSISIPAGDTRIFGVFATQGWANSNGLTIMQASAAALRAAIIRLP